MTSLSKTMASFSRAEGILAVLLGLGFVLGFLLTPLGVETRMNELRTPVFAGFFITVGLLAVIDASLTFLIAPADQAKFFFTVIPPPAVSIGEYILILVGIGYMLFGPRVYSQTR